jgi:uncharacterized protein (DUF924 family)
VADAASKTALSEVLSFCFAEGPADRWFKKDPAFDGEVRARLADLHVQAATGAFDAWRGSADGCVGLCMLLDQAPRNLFRGERRTFATDRQALAVTRHALEQGFDRQLPQVKRLFLYLPLEHSECLADQDLCVRLVAALDENPDWLDYAVRHRDIIARFGRFPHRNAVLGRTSTAEEEAFLKQPGSSF